MKRAITTIYLVVLDGPEPHVEQTGPRAWYSAIRSLSARMGHTVALDQHGRRVGTAQCPIVSEPVTVTARDGSTVVDDASAAAAVAIAERCSTARERVEALGGAWLIRDVTEWRARKREKGQPVGAWRGEDAIV